VCGALPDDSPWERGLEALPNRRVAPDGRNPTYGSLMVLYYARERIADFIHRKDAKDAESGKGFY